MKETTKKKFKKTAILASMILGALTLNNCKDPVNGTSEEIEKGNEQQPDAVEKEMELIYIAPYCDENGNAIGLYYYFSNKKPINIGNEYVETITASYGNFDETSDPYFIETLKNSDGQLETKLNGDKRFNSVFVVGGKDGTSEITTQVGPDCNVKMKSFFDGKYNLKFQNTRYTGITRVDLPIQQNDNMVYMFYTQTKTFAQKALNDDKYRKDVVNVDFVNITGIDSVEFFPIKSKISSNIDGESRVIARQNAEQYIKSDTFKKELSDYKEYLKNYEESMIEADRITEENEGNKAAIIEGNELPYPTLAYTLYEKGVNMIKVGGATKMLTYDSNKLALDCVKIAEESLENRTFNHTVVDDTNMNPNFNKKSAKVGNIGKLATEKQR